MNAALEQRVADLERQVRLIASRVTPRRSGGRVSKATAAEWLDCSTATVKRYVSRGLLIPLPKPAGSSRNAATYFDPGNVLALVESEDAAREWIARRKYVSHR